jgi:hypothetical protein
VSLVDSRHYNYADCPLSEVCFIHTKFRHFALLPSPGIFIIILTDAFIVFCFSISISGDDPVAARSEARALSARTLDRWFESRLRHECLSSSFHVVLSCVGRSPAES